MFPIERQTKIIDLLTIKKVVTITSLLETLNISIETLRRDLNTLQKQGKVEKIYGGVKLSGDSNKESSMDERMVSHLHEKEAIAKTCATFIHDGDCIYIDSGSTTYQLTKYLKSKKNITVITNSIPVVQELMNSKVEVIILGGRVRHTEQSIISYDHISNLDELNIIKSFICAGGITIEKGISDYNVEEARTRRKIIEVSKEVFVMADHTKLERDVTVNIAPLHKVNYIVTNDASEEFIESFEDITTKLLIVE